MFDLSFAEILVILSVALIVLGPEKLPRFARFIGSTINKIKGLGHQIQDDLINKADDKEMCDLGQTLKDSVEDLTQQVKKDFSELKGNIPDFTQEEIENINDKEQWLPFNRPPVKSSLANKYRNNQRNKYKQQITLNKSPLHKRSRTLK